MFEVKVSPQAAEDLLGIKNYIENELQNPIAAQNTVLKIIETYENLSNFPNSGISVTKYISFPTDYRFVLANNYSIFYRIEKEVVRVVRILYSRKDFVHILFDGQDKNT
ncbi:type II toxin-antitoxin system RelE/ParE family toxin [Treponema parvum]|uniref:Type II toxin-antitoxin system RelE/ParE family toxin n=1 Tax=Treponema parvum TaxID=138851 RepID=A0A975F3H9_9SPIR|nr:type II toxin-antitoxin system RelE/ParE family toxin [Treponema parvum]QTQ14045.1 type II toxin-antitoxin system RelE/ParE family toxin [Treponema parvum]